MSNIIEHFYEDRDSLFAALSDYCQLTLSEACQANDAASFMVSGGSTPAPLYDSLSQLDLPWSKIHVALVDERWVDKDHSASNTAFAERTLIKDKAANCRFIPIKSDFDSAQQGLAHSEALYQQLPQPFDITVLGMGKDGHTASLFPHAQGLEDALSLPAKGQKAPLLAAIMANKSEVTGDSLERITLSLHGLLQSRQLILLITGEDKLAVLRQAQNCTNVADMPLAAVLQQNQVPVHVFWAP